MNEAKWYLRTADETFGPETEKRLVEWAQMGRIQPGQEISDDRENWRNVEDVPFLDMRFSIDLGDGHPRGPFNKAAADALLASGRLPRTASIVETRAPFGLEAERHAPGPDEPGNPPVAQKPAEEERDAARIEPRIVEKIVEKRVEVPVEKIVVKEIPVERVVEKIVEKEVPVEVEKIIEKRVEVPVEVEKIVEKIVEKVVVDETRVKELEGLLAEERRHTADLQARMDAAAKTAAEREKAGEERFLAEAKEHSSREAALREKISALEEELRRLPQSASEIADIQAAVYSLMTKEAEEIETLMAQEKDDAEEFRRRHEERRDHLIARRRELLKRAGTDIGEMTRKALVNRPEDPRTAQLRAELDELRRLDAKKSLEAERRISDLTARLRLREAEAVRSAENRKDVVQLQAELQETREKLQLREKELVSERQRIESLRQQQAVSQQSLMTRLASLESPSIGTTQSLSTNQSREAKLVKIPRWMRFGK
ncbi:MAG: hypothetical protein K6F50_09285 [Kiritimatiellae bacterium]|nr:hypothetical protein [Kiritimatiellia bacterium]